MLKHDKQFETSSFFSRFDGEYFLIKRKYNFERFNAIRFNIESNFHA